MDKRTTLALLLMAALLMIYPAIFMRSEPEKKPAQKTEVRRVAFPKGPDAVPPTDRRGPRRTGAAEGRSGVPDRTATIEAPCIAQRSTVSEDRLRSWELHYRGAKPMVAPGFLASRGLSVARAGPALAPGGVRALDRQAHPRAEHAEPADLVLTGEDGFGLARDRDVALPRRIAMSSTTSSRSRTEQAVPQNADIGLGGRPRSSRRRTPRSDSRASTRSASCAGADGSVHRDLREERRVQWRRANGSGSRASGISTATRPEQPRNAARPRPRSARPGADAAKPVELSQVGLRIPLSSLKPGQIWEGQIQSYMGPKEYDRLKAVGVGLEKSIYFGGFPAPQNYGGLPMEWLAVPDPLADAPVLRVHPQLRRGDHPAHRDHEGPLLPADDQEHDVDEGDAGAPAADQCPAHQVQERSRSGCSARRWSSTGAQGEPARRLLCRWSCRSRSSTPSTSRSPSRSSIQNAPFICFGRLFGVDLWICDLAAHDPTYVLPILMGISMFIQQKMTPVMGDPRQAKMMLFMPVVFTFMFLNLPAGLVLYWTLSNVLQIAQQKYMERIGKKPEKLRHGQPRRPDRSRRLGSVCGKLAAVPGPPPDLLRELLAAIPRADRSASHGRAPGAVSEVSRRSSCGGIGSTA